MGEEGLTFHHDLERSFAQIHFVHVSVLNFKAKALGLFAELHHHLRATDTLGVAGEIFDVAREHELPTGHVARKHQRVEHGAPRIEASGVACRS